MNLYKTWWGPSQDKPKDRYRSKHNWEYDGDFNTRLEIIRLRILQKIDDKHDEHFRKVILNSNSRKNKYEMNLSVWLVSWMTCKKAKRYFLYKILTLNEKDMQSKRIDQKKKIPKWNQRFNPSIHRQISKIFQ